MRIHDQRSGFLMKRLAARRVAVDIYRRAQLDALGAAAIELGVAFRLFVRSALRLCALDCIVNPAHVIFPQAGGWVAADTIAQ